MHVLGTRLTSFLLGYGNVNTGTSASSYVYFSTETVENHGHLRYMTELAPHDDYELERGFVAEACGLPNTYNEDAYSAFIQDWGTVIHNANQLHH